MNIPDYIVVALLGGVIALDKASFQMLLSEPVIICASAGAYFGHLELGITFGLMWQLLWMGEVPIGATKYPDGPTGAVLSTSLYLTLLKIYPQGEDLLLALCIISGIIIAYLGGGFIAEKRKFHAKYVNYIDKYSSQGKLGKIETLFSLALLEHFCSRTIYALVIFIVFKFLLKNLLTYIPVFWNGLFSDIHIAVWGIALAVIINLIWNRKTFWAVGSGMVLGFIMIWIL